MLNKIVTSSICFTVVIFLMFLIIGHSTPKDLDERAEEEARALELMIKSQIDVIINALGYQNAFLSSLFTALLLQHLESVLEGNEEDFRKDASSFAALLTSTQDKAHR